MQMCCLLHACFLHYLSCGLICCVTQFFFISLLILLYLLSTNTLAKGLFSLFEIPFTSDPFHRLTCFHCCYCRKNVYCLFIFFKGMYICNTKLWVILPPDHHGISIFFFLSWILFFLLFEQIERQIFFLF